jgi:DNA repair exonuclease SbcCD ATPase subunit
MNPRDCGAQLKTVRNIRRLGIVGFTLVCLVGMTACNRNNHSIAAPAAQMVSHLERADSAHSTLSREHSVTIEVPESDLHSSFQRLTDRCTADSANHCTILQSDVSSGQFSSGLMRLRIDPKAVEDLIGFATGLGRLEHRSTQVEDLADAIQDTQSRIEMLTTYRKQLLELQGKAGTNIDAAIKVASELSTVQSSLEQATGQAAYQTKRTTTDIVTIHFSVSEQKAFWRPIHDAVRDFLGNLSEGISQAITAVAYILPWLLVVIPGLYLVRFLWRRRGR